MLLENGKALALIIMMTFPLMEMADGWWHDVKITICSLWTQCSQLKSYIPWHGAWWMALRRGLNISWLKNILSKAQASITELASHLSLTTKWLDCSANYQPKWTEKNNVINVNKKLKKNSQREDKLWPKPPLNPEEICRGDEYLRCKWDWEKYCWRPV